MTRNSCYDFLEYDGVNYTTFAILLNFVRCCYFALLVLAYFNLTKSSVMFFLTETTVASSLQSVVLTIRVFINHRNLIFINFIIIELHLNCDKLMTCIQIFLLTMGNCREERKMLREGGLRGSLISL